MTRAAAKQDNAFLRLFGAAASEGPKPDSSGHGGGPEALLDANAKARHDAHAHGAQAMRAGSSSFAAATRLFDARTRESTMMLYAWCRHCDDVIDGQTLGRTASVGAHDVLQTDAHTDLRADSAMRLAELECSTRLACAGRPGNDPVFVGLAEVVRRHDLPIHLLLEHLAGFRMDVEQMRYHSLADTLVYCHRVAGVVGLMMAKVMGANNEAALSCARDLGVAFQLSNIARDVIEDAAVGRIYLPSAWLFEAGITSENLRNPAHRQAVSTVVARIVDAADGYYASSLAGIRSLPLRCAWSVATARDLYRAIGHKVKQRGANAWDDRTRTSSFDKLWFTARGAGVALAFKALPARTWIK